MRGKVVLITGGTHGIGQAMAERLAENGAIVWVTTRTAIISYSDEPAEPGEIRAIQLDVTNEQQVKDVISTIIQLQHHLDVLVNNAGIGIFKTVMEISLEEWNNVIQTNLTGVFLCSREVFGWMQRQGGGRIINISSVAGYIPLAKNSAYGTSKYAVSGFSQCLNEEGKQHNIRVSVIYPGMVSTDMTKVSGFAENDMLKPEDVAETVLDIARRPLHVRIDEVKILPSKGIL